MRWSYRPALDGLRTVAVYAVLLFHTAHPWATGGFVGVDLFFVLSGFLVTSVIISEIGDRGTLRLLHFYTRRVRRLLPAAVVTVVATCAVFVLVAPVTRRLELVGDAQSALLYYANWHFLAASGDYFAANVDKSPFLHFWSLAIEEQYYLFFPVLVLLLSRWRRGWLVSVIAVLTVGSIVAQLAWARVDASHAYYGTDARLYQLLVGSLLALGLNRLLTVSRRVPWGVVTWLALAGFVVLSSGLLDWTPSARGLIAAVVSCAMVAGLMLKDTSVPARLLSMRVPVFLGKISYGTYLWHWPVIVVLRQVFDTSPRVVAVLTIALGTGLAALSYEVLEMPIRKSARLDRWRWAPALVGVATSAVLALTLVPGLLAVSQKPELVAADAAKGGTQAQTDVHVPAGVDWKAVAADRGQEHWCTAADPDACTVIHGSGPHILLIGDSQAQTLVPMFEQLAREHNATLSLNVVAGCPWQENLTNAKMKAGARADCESARVGWYENVLPRIDPDLVVVMSRPRDGKAWQRLTQRRDGVKQPLDKMTLQTTDQTLRAITAVAPKTLLVERLVMPETFDPADCLATRDDSAACAVPVPLRPSITDGIYEAAAAASGKVDVLDLNPVFCRDAPTCLPVVHDEIVWRDDHHLTASYATSRREAVWKAMEKAGAFTG